MTKKKQTERPYDSFMATLIQQRDDNGKMAALRRGLGRKPGEVAETSREIQCALAWDDPEVKEKERAYYLVGPLFGLYHDEITDEGNLGQHLRDLCEPGEEPPPSIERRFMALLTCDGDEFDDQLRQVIFLIKSKKVEVNWQRLLHDVRQWQRGEITRNRVRQEWSRSFWRSERRAAPPNPLAMSTIKP
jgi:CRISPR system Cascade subunit CasB